MATPAKTVMAILNAGVNEVLLRQIEGEIDSKLIDTEYVENRKYGSREKGFYYVFTHKGRLTAAEQDYLTRAYLVVGYSHVRILNSDMTTIELYLPKE